MLGGLVALALLLTPTSVPPPTSVPGPTSVPRPTSVPGPTSVPVFQAGTPCAAAVGEQLNAWGAHGDLRTVPGLPGDRSRQVGPTTRLGVWLDLRVRDDGRVSLARVSAEGIAERQWDAGCVGSTRNLPNGAPGKGARHLFTDQDLAQNAAASDLLAVYVWSPHMPLSVDGLAHAARATERLGIALVPVVDPRADRAYVERVAREAGLPESATRAAASVELAFRDALVHAPTLLLYVDGHAAAPAIPGYRDAAGYEALLRTHLTRRGR